LFHFVSFVSFCFILFHFVSAFRLVANDTLVSAWGAQSKGREWLGIKLRTTPG
jgi:hypothetical protein